MSFLSTLGKAIDEQYSIGQKNSTSLDRVENGRTVNFGLLGDFANKFDQSATRSYIEDGLINNIKPRLREIIWQQPDITILVKKRMFSSIAENYKLELSSYEEKLFYKASKTLFQNKCKAISIYERLTKIEAFAKEAGKINENMLPSLYQLLSEATTVPILNSLFSDDVKASIQTIQRIYTFSQPNNVTTWIKDPNSLFSDSLGEGTGVIELTLVNSISCNSSVDFGGGGASFSIIDPYNLFVITQEDIESAIAEAASGPGLNTFEKFSQEELTKTIDQQKIFFNELRSSRGASPIDIMISTQGDIQKSHNALDVSVGNRVFAIVRNTGKEIKFNYEQSLFSSNPVEIDSESLIDSDTLDVNGLNPKEAKEFSRIIVNIFTYLQSKKLSANKSFQFNQETNFVRKKLMLHYAGKNLIQPRDTVSIFVTSRTEKDPKLTQGFNPTNGGFDIVNKINSLFRNINESLNIFSENSFDHYERDVLAKDVPLWMWKMVRGDANRQTAGVCVFNGLVKGCSSAYSNGAYNLSITCEDNTAYFALGQTNFKPSLDVYNGALYDPLTPFKISFDASTGGVLTDVQQGQFPELLDENKSLLASGALKFKTGRFRGEPVTDASFGATSKENYSGGYRNVIACPDGFVYRWKEGIGALTKTARTVQTQSSVVDDRPPGLTAQVFAGQDVMNVISILVTGIPYNYNSFLKSAMENANGVVSRNDGQNQGSAKTYLDGILGDISKNNLIWGNFIPFKSLTINSDAEAFIRSGLHDITTQNAKLNGLLTQKAKLMDDIRRKPVRMTAPGPDGTPQQTEVDTQLGELQQRLAKLNAEINVLSDQFEKTKNDQFASNSNRLKIIGDDISYEEAPGQETEEQRLRSREEMKKRINALTLRRVWQVKSNQDNNLFVVDSQYDENWDIQAFERKLGGALELFNSEWGNSADKISQVAKLLDLEVFADSQGHIQARPPQYNRIPSSVLFKMLKDKDEKGIQIFPEYLESLFFNQAQGLTRRIEVIEDEIRLRAAALGFIEDFRIMTFLGQGIKKGSFGFLTNESGDFGEKDYRQTIYQAKPDLTEDFAKGPLESTLSRINSLVGKTDQIFTALEKNYFINNNLLQTGDKFFREDADNAFDAIANRIQRKTGAPAKKKKEILQKSKEGILSSLDFLGVTNQISGFIAERERVLNQLVNAIRNLKDGVLLNERGISASGLFPHLNRNTGVPGVLQHMVENEENDDIGPHSGKRFVISDSHIISYTIAENPPQYVQVQVNGLFGEGLVEPVSGLALGDRGNVVTSAFAVDYDMWRMYGFSVPQAIEAPYFSDPDSQAAPLAVFLLNRARKNILKGSIVVVGNEYYQPGDVVYIESRKLLFYVKNVEHSIGYSATYTTTLTLEYGHNPGEYIPTMLDIVGKALYGAKSTFAQYRHSRFENASGDKPIGAIMATTSNQDSIDSIVKGKFAKQNLAIMFNLLGALTGAFNAVGYKREKPILHLRIYGEGSEGSAHSLRVVADNILKWMRSPTAEGIDSNEVAIISPFKQQSFDSDSVRVVFINVSDPGEYSPSSYAWDSVRLFTNSAVTDGEALKDVLFGNIIDCWLTTEPIEDVKEKSDSQSQAAQEMNAEIAAAEEGFSAARDVDGGQTSTDTSEF